MAFHSLMIKLAAELLEHLSADPHVIELGNQTFKPRQDILARVASFLEASGKPFDRSEFSSLSDPDADLSNYTRRYYRSIGYSSYSAIDVNEKYGSIIMDLNLDIKQKYGFDDCYDLVTNNGTGEHIFNQAMVFQNVHHLTRMNGLMAYVLPFYNWINHGFFSFHPILFVDLAAANGYELLRLSVASNRGPEVTATLNRERKPRRLHLPGDPVPNELPLELFQQRVAVRPADYLGRFRFLGRGASRREPELFARVIASLARRRGDVSVVAVMRKIRNEPFRMPVQGMYGGDNIESEEIQRRYQIGT